MREWNKKEESWDMGSKKSNSEQGKRIPGIMMEGGPRISAVQEARRTTFQNGASQKVPGVTSPKRGIR